MYLPEIHSILVEQNPWWRGDFRVDYKPREIYQELRRFLPQPQILALTGLRRVGKTTLLLKTVEDALAEGTEPRRILYFSFDEFRETGIRDIVRAYEEMVGTEMGSGAHLLLLDEVQKLEGWEDQLKAFYDRHKGRVKVLVSGSQSLFLRRGSRETLAGRLFEFRVDPLSFPEHLAFRGVPFEPLELHRDEVARRLPEYMRTQGFPELVGEEDRGVVKKYLEESIVGALVFRDLPILLPIRDVEVLRSVLRILMEEPGQIVLLEDLAGQLRISRHTLSAYLSYLEDAFLLRKLYNYATGRRKVERKLKRYYPTVLSVELLFRNDSLARSRALEWLAVNQLRGEYFWRDPYKREVDVVLPGTPPVPVEVTLGRTDLRSLGAFMRKFRAPRGYVVTWDREGDHPLEGGRVREVPAYGFLLTWKDLVRESS